VRTEFGYERSSCACKECRRWCFHLPGYLIPADLKRMIPAHAQSFDWAEQNLLASPGALVVKDRVLFRIPTLVPATSYHPRSTTGGQLSSAHRPCEVD